MTILSKKEMSEEDIKLQFITPSITDKWDKNRNGLTLNINDAEAEICCKRKRMFFFTHIKTEKGEP